MSRPKSFPPKLSDPATPLDLHGLAVDFLGRHEAASALRWLVETVGRMRRHEGLVGHGAAAAGAINAAAEAANTFVKRASGLDLLTLMEAIRGAPIGAEGKSVAPEVLSFPRMTSYRELADQFGRAEHLARNLNAAGKAREKLPRGRPRLSRILDFAVAALEAIWREHSTAEPTRLLHKGAFGGLAEKLLVEPPCGFAPGAVSRAVAKRIPRSRGVQPPTRPREGDPLRRVLLVSADADDALTRELAYQFGEAGVRATVAVPQPWPEDLKVSELTDVVVLDFLCGTESPSVTALGRGRFDLILFTGLTGDRAPLPASDKQSFHAVDQAAWLQALVIPVRVHGLLARLSAQGRLHRRAKIVVVGSHVGSVAMNGSGGDYVTRTVMGGLISLVRNWAYDLRGAGVRTAFVYPGWGRDITGALTRHPRARESAMALRETIGRLGDGRNGHVLDLYGSIAPH